MYLINKYKVKIFFIFGFLIISVIYGSLPFILSSGYNQIFGQQGFASSFNNQNLDSIKAINFGYPTNNPLYSGLPYMKLSSIFLKLNILEVDAYNLSVLVLLFFGYTGAYLWGRMFLGRINSSLSAILLFSQPIIWFHAEYSSLGASMAIFPFCSYLIFKFNKENNLTLKSWFIYILIVLFTNVFLLFMDGYTYVMFSAFTYLNWLFYCFIKAPKLDNKKFFMENIDKLFLLLFSSFVAVYSFTQYAPNTLSSTFDVDHFRGWGVDLLFIFQPTKDMNFFFDTLGMSSQRNAVEMFGDTSVWVSTYILPIVLYATFRLFKKNVDTKLTFLFTLLVLISLYLSLGPSLKLNSIKPEYLNTRLMDSRFGIFELGSEFIYSYVPGIRTMRATYRWLFLTTFSLWILGNSSINKLKNKKNIALTLFILILLSLPNLKVETLVHFENRNKLVSFQKDIIPVLKSNALPGQIILFIPFENSIYANLIASNGKLITYNISGDKNFDFAKQKWPNKIFKIDDMFKNSKDFNHEKLEELLTNELIVLPVFSFNTGGDSIGKPFYEPCFKSISPTYAFQNCKLNNKLAFGYDTLIGELKASNAFKIIEVDNFVLISKK